MKTCEFNLFYDEHAEELEKRGLKMIEFTSNLTGYPEGLYKGLAGFNTFEEAQDFAKKYGLEVVSAHQRDGWQLWYSDGWQTKPLDIEDYFQPADHDVSWYGNTEDDRKRLFEDLKGTIEGLSSIEEIKAIADLAFEVQDKLDEIDDDETIMVDNGEYTVYKQHPTRIHDDDVMTYIIAVI